MQFLVGLQDSTIAIWVSESDWAYPFILTCHALGMAGVIGFVVVVSLRALGLWSGVSLAGMDAMVPVAGCGFALNLLSGVLLFLPNGPDLIVNPAFVIKLAAIVSGGVALWLLMREVAAASATDSRIGAKGKAIATICLVLWLGAITAGRLIAYVM